MSSLDSDPSLSFSQLFGTKDATVVDWYKADPDSHTEIGQKIHDIKYVYASQWEPGDEEIQGKIITKLKEICDLVVEHLEVKGWTNVHFDAVVPVPSFEESLYKKPAYGLAVMLAKTLSTEHQFILQKVESTQAKTDSIGENAIALKDGVEVPRRILLIDDLYNTGKSAQLSVFKLQGRTEDSYLWELLSGAGGDSVPEIYFLAMAKTKFGGLSKKVSASLSSSCPKKAKNGNEYLEIEFMLDDRKQKVCVFENQPYYEKVREVFTNSPSSTVPIRVKRNLDNHLWKFEGFA